MAIFAIIPQPGANAEKLAPKVTSTFPTHLSITPSGWLIASTGTAQEVSDKLDITATDANGAAIILEVASYFGRANPTIWSWIKTNWERPTVG
jgi:hypothetical protein